MPAFLRSPRLRLSVWIAAVLVLFFGQIIWIGLLRNPSIADRHAVIVAGEVVLSAIIILIAILLWTTPADAIQLKRFHSEWIILTGAVVLQVFTRGADRSAPAISAAIIIGTAILLAFLRQRKASAWWAVLLAWNPWVVVFQFSYGTS